MPNRTDTQKVLEICRTRDTGRAFIADVESGLEGLEAVSTGACPDCPECADLHRGGDLEEYNREYEGGGICAKPHFSKSACDICGSGLSGDRGEWHAIDRKTGEIIHGSGCCVDCMLYIANGDLPQTTQP